MHSLVQEPAVTAQLGRTVKAMGVQVSAPRCVQLGTHVPLDQVVALRCCARLACTALEVQGNAVAALLGGTASPLE